MPGNTTRSGRRLRLSRAGARCRPCGQPVSPTRSPHPACGSHRTGRSTCLGRWSAAGDGCCRTGSPWGRNVATAVAVAGHFDAGRAGEPDPVAGESPPLVAEATAEFLDRQPGASLVLGAYPAHQPTPCEVVDRVENVLRHPVPEVVRPARQGPVQAADQLVEILVA